MLITSVRLKPWFKVFLTSILCLGLAIRLQLQEPSHWAVVPTVLKAMSILLATLLIGRGLKVGFIARK